MATSILWVENEEPALPTLALMYQKSGLVMQVNVRARIH
jgi:hypothetical protein